MVSIRAVATSVPIFYEIFLVVVIICTDETANAFNVAGMFLIVIGEYLCVCAAKWAGFEFFCVTHIYHTPLLRGISGIFAGGLLHSLEL